MRKYKITAIQSETLPEEVAEILMKEIEEKLSTLSVTPGEESIKNDCLRLINNYHYLAKNNKFKAPDWPTSTAFLAQVLELTSENKEFMEAIYEKVEQISDVLNELEEQIADHKLENGASTKELISILNKRNRTTNKKLKKATIRTVTFEDGVKLFMTNMHRNQDKHWKKQIGAGGYNKVRKTYLMKQGTITEFAARKYMPEGSPNTMLEELENQLIGLKTIQELRNHGLKDHLLHTNTLFRLAGTTTKNPKSPVLQLMPVYKPFHVDLFAQPLEDSKGNEETMKNQLIILIQLTEVLKYKHHGDLNFSQLLLNGSYLIIADWDPLTSKCIGGTIAPAEALKARKEHPHIAQKTTPAAIDLYQIGVFMLQLFSKDHVLTGINIDKEPYKNTWIQLKTELDEKLKNHYKERLAAYTEKHKIMPKEAPELKAAHAETIKAQESWETLMGIDRLIDETTNCFMPLSFHLTKTPLHEEIEFAEKATLELLTDYFYEQVGIKREIIAQIYDCLRTACKGPREKPEKNMTMKKLNKQLKDIYNHYDRESPDNITCLEQDPFQAITV